MFYNYIVNGRVGECIPAIDPAIPNIPIEERYQAEFLALCVKSEHRIEAGWYYDPEHGYSPDPFPVPPEPHVPTIDEKIEELEEAFDILVEGLV